MLIKSPKRTIIKDVVKELSKVQKSEGSLVHEMVSDVCFEFFSDAMKATSEMDLLGLYFPSAFLITLKKFNDFSQFNNKKNHK